MKVLSIVATLAASLLAAPAVAQGVVANPSGPWTHAASGVAFPDTSGTFKRAEIQQFDKAGNDVGVTYQWMENGDTVGLSSVYVYPVKGDSCAASWQAEQKESVTNGNKISDEGRAASPSGATANAAYHAKMTMAFSTADNPVASSVYLYCVPGGKWLVKYYASWRGTGDREAETVKLVRAIAWPEAFRK